LTAQAALRVEEATWKFPLRNEVPPWAKEFNPGGKLALLPVAGELERR
jgi:hypothetical protein